jgi:hypothetical protein
MAPELFCRLRLHGRAVLGQVEKLTNFAARKNCFINKTGCSKPVPQRLVDAIYSPATKEVPV